MVLEQLCSTAMIWCPAFLHTAVFSSAPWPAQPAAYGEVLPEPRSSGRTWISVCTQGWAVHRSDIVSQLGAAPVLGSNTRSDQILLYGMASCHLAHWQLERLAFRHTS